MIDEPERLPLYMSPADRLLLRSAASSQLSGTHSRAAGSPSPVSPRRSNRRSLGGSRRTSGDGDTLPLSDLLQGAEGESVSPLIVSRLGAGQSQASPITQPMTMRLTHAPNATPLVEPVMPATATAIIEFNSQTGSAESGSEVGALLNPAASGTITGGGTKGSLRNRRATANPMRSRTQSRASVVSATSASTRSTYSARPVLLPEKVEFEVGPNVPGALRPTSSLRVASRPLLSGRASATGMTRAMSALRVPFQPRLSQIVPPPAAATRQPPAALEQLMMEAIPERESRNRAYEQVVPVDQQPPGRPSADQINALLFEKYSRMRQMTRSAAASGPDPQQSARQLPPISSVRELSDLTQVDRERNPIEHSLQVPKLSESRAAAPQPDLIFLGDRSAPPAASASAPASAFSTGIGIGRQYSAALPEGPADALAFLRSVTDFSRSNTGVSFDKWGSSLNREASTLSGAAASISQYSQYRDLLNAMPSTSANAIGTSRERSVGRQQQQQLQQQLAPRPSRVFLGHRMLDSNTNSASNIERLEGLFFGGSGSSRERSSRR